MLIALSTPAAGQERMIDLAAETLRASDITTTEVSALARRTDLRTEWTATLVHGRIALDYAPAAVDLLGYPTTRNETRTNARVSGRIATSDRLNSSLGAGTYQGFTDFRSVWLDEYYRQLFEGVDGYRRADPRGFDCSAGGRWEYLSASGFITADFRFQRDEVSPGYEKNPFEPLHRGRSRLDTWSASLGSEHVLNRTMRFKQDFEAVNTTARPRRLRYAAEHTWAVTERWVARSRLEAAKEGTFHSASAGVTLDRDWGDTWFLGIAVRAYRDNGQIIDPDLISGASPGLDTLLATVSLRYSGLRSSASFAIGPYHTRYAELAPGTQRFAGLYRDRDWLWAQAIWSILF